MSVKVAINGFGRIGRLAFRETVKRSSNNVIEFLQSEGYIRFKADSEASSRSFLKSFSWIHRCGA